MATSKTVKKNPLAASLVTPDAALAAIVGSKPLARTEITKKLWDYIKANKLQDKRLILASKDAKLSAVLGKKDLDMMKLAGEISKHVTK
ncbi:MAG: SWIB/MDM2 domain-containing protein [Mycoplasmataceae bacterium]|jgi:DNA topoisomerase-3|nr:SWIB/MDM2 domain-containing protein [Mycoplasmataceae bacterium]